MFQIIITKVTNDATDSIDLDFTGLSITEVGKETESSDWYKKSNLQCGDEITIRIKDVLENTPPVEIQKGKLESEIDAKLRNYHELKKELSKQGLI